MDQSSENKIALKARVINFYNLNRKKNIFFSSNFNNIFNYNIVYQT